MKTRSIYPALQFATGFFNAVTVIPLLFIIPVALYVLLSGKGRHRGARKRGEVFYFSGLAFGLIVAGAVITIALGRKA